MYSIVKEHRSLRMRGPNGPDLEWQERTRKIRADARKGRNAAEIADVYQLPVVAVQRMLAPTEHPRLSDPVDLIRTGQVGAGKAPAKVQLYWFGFLTAAGDIRGHGAALTLVVTLGEEGRDRIDTLLADLLSERLRWEFCHSSIVGWQVYLRDQAFCEALLPWGVPSDLYGEDPAVLEDFREEFVVPFMCGYVDGSKIGRRGRAHRRPNGFAVRGTPAVLAEINALVQRWWGISSGVISQVHGRAELRFTDPAAGRAIQSRLDMGESRF